MPYIPVRWRIPYLNAGSDPPAPGAGQVVSGLFFPYGSAFYFYDRPSLLYRWDFESFWVPVAFTAHPTATAPTVATISLQMFISAELVFQQSISLDCVAIPPAPWVGGSGQVNSSLNNPIAYRGQTLDLGYQLAFDQPVDQVYLGLCSVGDGAGGLGFAPGSIGYTMKPQLLTAA
jgi:hypothetical protein